MCAVIFVAPAPSSRMDPTCLLSRVLVVALTGGAISV